MAPRIPSASPWNRGTSVPPPRGEVERLPSAPSPWPPSSKGPSAAWPPAGTASDASPSAAAAAVPLRSCILDMRGCRLSGDDGRQIRECPLLNRGTCL
eukprot:CAMPEP_0169435074 /NCGR_PEP_ID=MMETSP1042-20121227/4870_1 /TAXON_ID=464988 /ORGANISM="Hemiselmis andersenii, Strain CCMP1180" /LENGTH=97 /DNA_ID=CAMNT_0009545695 /DNA_START=3756 /DNA_END=4049 /DNA_ORIENTATION=+